MRVKGTKEGVDNQGHLILIEKRVQGVEYCSILSALGLVDPWLMNEYMPRCGVFVNTEYLVLIKR